MMILGLKLARQGFSSNVNKISKVGHGDLLLIRDTPLPLVPRYDDAAGTKTLKVTGRTRKRLQTDGRTHGRTTPYHNTSRQRRAHKKEKPGLGSGGIEIIKCTCIMI